MTTAIYVVAAGHNAGKALVGLGLMSTLVTKSDNIGYFKPFTTAATPDADRSVAMMRERFGLPEAATGCAITLADARQYLARGDAEGLSVVILDAYAAVADHCDLVIIEGSEDGLLHDTNELESNLQIANDMGAMVAAVVSGVDRTIEDIVDAVDVTRGALDAAGVPVLMIAVNRAAPDDVSTIAAAVHLGPSGRPVYVFPETDALQWPTVDDIQVTTGAVAVGGASTLDRDVRRFRVAAMGVNGFLEVFEDGDFVIVPADRVDILTALLASALSDSFPTPSGVLVIGFHGLDARVADLLDHAPFPVLSLEGDTYTTTRAVLSTNPKRSWYLPRRLETATAIWDAAVDPAEILSRIDLPRPTTMTPVRFGFSLFQRAAHQRKCIVLPEGDDPRILRAAQRLRARDVVDLVVLGEPQQVHAAALAEGVDLGDVPIVDPATSEHRESFAREYAKLRAHKGMTLEGALERMHDVSYFGTMMVHMGLVDGMVSGAQHTTAHTIKPAFEIIKTVPGVSIVSSVFLMCLADRVLVYGDCAVNPDPNAEQLADIAFASAQTAEQFGIAARVAMLSYSTGASGHGASVDKVREATELVRDAHPELVVDGPIQYDAASNERIGSSKLPGSAVAGHATVFVFPDLDTGNNTYKAVQQSSGAIAIGPILQGLRQPVNDLSRGCTVDDIINTVVITAIQAQR